jgi:hypothetical protein
LSFPAALRRCHSGSRESIQASAARPEFGTVRAGITLSPISTSGYNWDAVVENNTTAFPPNTAEYLHNPKFALFETGYRNDQYRLPTSGAISASTGSETLNFQLMPYGSGTGLSNNALYLNIRTTRVLDTLH